MRVLVLGAGVIGTTTAWYLAAAGHEVAVIDRQPAAGMETSRGSLGQVSVTHPEPWAAPGMRTRVLATMLGRDAPLRMPLRFDTSAWRWAASFLRECGSERFEHNLRQLAAFAVYSREQLDDLRRQTGLDYERRDQGLMHFYTSEATMRAAERTTAILADHGAIRHMLDRAEAVRVEPALAALGSRLIGASVGDDETGDAHKFTRELARVAAEQGVHFHYATRIVGLVRQAGRITGVQVQPLVGLEPRTRTLTAEAFVLAAGTHSPAIARQVGVRLAIQPAKGLSVTVPIRRPEQLAQRSLGDESLGIGITRLGDRLRIGGTVSLVGDDLSIDERLVGRMVARGRELFHDACDWHKGTTWCGLRPATSSGLPYVGRSAIENLYLNTGHGALGFTLAAGSARALVDILGGLRPPVQFGFSGPAGQSAARSGQQTFRPAGAPSDRRG